MQPNLNHLQQLLQKLPGIGPRQARRFAYFLLSVDKQYVTNLISHITELRQARSLCSFCHRIFFSHNKDILCPTCTNKNTVLSKILIIEKNSDFENFEKNLVWDGRYFLTGRNLKLTELTIEKLNSMKTLISEIESGRVEEIVFALSAHQEGEYTTEMIIKELRPFCSESDVKISKLARGLSSGSEIEYTDGETLRQAIEKRS